MELKLKLINNTTVKIITQTQRADKFAPGLTMHDEVVDWIRYNNINIDKLELHRDIFAYDNFTLESCVTPEIMYDNHMYVRGSDYQLDDKSVTIPDDLMPIYNHVQYMTKLVAAVRAYNVVYAKNYIWNTKTKINTSG